MIVRARRRAASIAAFASAVLASVVFASHAAAVSLCDTAPPAIDGQPARVWTGDFDADGKPDRVWFLPPQAVSATVRDRVTDPWAGLRRRFDPAIPTLVIAHGKRCSLVQKARFFSSPIWEEADKPIKVLLRTDPAIKDWSRVHRRWRGDGVLLGTEAGVDLLLFWDGKRWRVAYGSEAP